MKYWEEFESKYGFNEGKAFPPEAVYSRFVYINIINYLAEQYNSLTRIIPDRVPTLHNEYRISFIGVEDYNKLPDSKNTDINWEPNLKIEEVEPDEIMNECICKARNLMLDDYIIVDVTIDYCELNILKTEIKNGSFDNL